MSRASPIGEATVETAALSRPEHVPPELVVDFDFFRPEGAEVDPFLALKRLHDKPDIFWTPRNGGHWVATRGDDIRAILTEPEVFSSRHVFIPKSGRPPIVPLELDPPDHEAYRRLLLPAFTPPAVAAWSQQARELAVSLIDGFHARGECEFIGEFAQQLPIIIFLRMCDLPLEDRDMLVGWVKVFVRPAEAGSGSREQMYDYIRRMVDERRAHPGEDMISRALHADVGGRKLNDEEAMGLINGLLGGGLDTVASSMGWVALFLARNPGHRRQLVEDPGLIPKAVDELLRRFSVPNIARTLKADAVYKGVEMKAGEQVLLPACLQAMDERTFEDPMAVDFRRADARMHCTFSQGVHRCPGSTLALQEIRIFLDEWLKRIPDFQVTEDAVVRTGTGIVHGVIELPLSWPVEG